MTNQEILTKTIQKAIDGGFNPNGMYGYPEVTKISAEIIYGKVYIVLGNLLFGVETLIFNHEFAKALWGEELMITRRVPHSPFADDPYPYAIIITAPAWQHHLQQMVIAEDPLAYLEENI